MFDPHLTCRDPGLLLLLNFRPMTLPWTPVVGMPLSWWLKTAWRTWVTHGYIDRLAG